ncbi:tripartite tricarboxylate transporter permease [Bacillaceae bacterium]
MLEHVLPSLIEFFSWPAPLYLILGTVLGTIVGVLPGLGGPQTLALLIPVSISMDPSMAIVLMMGVMGAIATGGSITAILINTPGQGESAATAIDGFALAKQGKAGYAIGAAVSASMFGGIFGAIILTLILPLGKMIVLAFSYQEYFMLAIMGISMIAVLSEGSLWKGFIAGFLGLLVSSIGYDPVTGSVRYAFGSDYLWDGIKLVPTIIGLFAVCEAISIFAKRQAIAQQVPDTKMVGVWEGFKSPFKYFGTFVRGSVIGTIIGIIPGVGGTVANFVAYGQEAQAAKKGEELGKGNIRGVIAPESANNAKDGGALVPTLIFGIPGSATTAVLLGALILHGIQPGPRLMLDNPDTVLLLIYALVGSNIVCAVLSLLAAVPLAKITFVPGTLIGSLVLVLALVGAYVSEFMIQDVVVSLVFGLMGFAMLRYGYSRVAFLIAFVLGELMQKSFHQSLITEGWQGFFTRPLSFALLLITIVMVVYSLRKQMRSTKSAKGGVSA